MGRFGEGKGGIEAPATVIKSMMELCTCLRALHVCGQTKSGIRSELKGESAFLFIKSAETLTFL